MKAKRVFSVAAIALSLCLLAGLCGCSGEAGTPAEPTGIEFQGIPWNSGPEEVCEALGSTTTRWSGRRTTTPSP